jgi:hypothetical protein
VNLKTGKDAAGHISLRSAAPVAPPEGPSWAFPATLEPRAPESAAAST